MKISELLRQTLADKLREQRVVVWYDAEQVFGDFVAQFRTPSCYVISAASSRLRARREAENMFRQLNARTESEMARASLLLYLPFARRKTNEARRQDPFEVFAVAGDTFGDDEAEKLESLSYQAMPELATQIGRLFRESEPTLAMLDELAATGPGYLLVQQVFGTQSAIEVAIQLLGDAIVRQKVQATAGCGAEILRLLQAEMGFTPPRIVDDWEQRWLLLGRYVLFSEFAFDLQDDLPDALANLPRATAAHQPAVLAVASGLRDRTSYRDAYRTLSEKVEQDLRLAQYFSAESQLGQRDTFPFEDRLQLERLIKVILAEELDEARSIIAGRSRSIWHEHPERAQRWRVAERSVAVVESASRVSQDVQIVGNGTSALIAAYTAETGWHTLDRYQRLMEQSIAECPDCDELELLIEFSRRRYQQAIETVQERFLDRVMAQGWPPEGVLRQTQIFNRQVAPILERREKVAYILADSLRYEMGHALASVLGELGEIQVMAAAASLPTITPVGMAALMPGADGLLAFREENSNLTPAIGERVLKHVNDRRDYLVEKFGDRVADIEIGEFLSLTSNKKRAARLNNADLVVIRDSRIDRFGEVVPAYEARKYMTNLLGDLKTAVVQLVRLGYHTLVIATDHGHVFLPEIQVGETVKQPAGYGGWLLAKRRCLLGQQIQAETGNLRFAAAQVTIQGDVSDYVVPGAFKVYTHGSGYFHEGLSLQECVVPVIIVRAKGQLEAQDETGIRFELRYRRDTFTSQVIALKAWYSSLLNPQLRVRIEAYNGSGPDARKVGDVAECEARDEVTMEVVLTLNEETAVPVLLEPDYRGDEVEIRATDSETGVIYGRLRLKNGTLD